MIGTMTQSRDSNKQMTTTSTPLSSVFAKNQQQSATFKRKSGLWGPHSFENDDAADWIVELFELMDKGLQSNKSIRRFKPIVAYTMAGVDSDNYNICRMAAHNLLFFGYLFRQEHKDSAMAKLKQIAQNKQWLEDTGNPEMIADDLRIQIERFEKSSKSDIDTQNELSHIVADWLKNNPGVTVEKDGISGVLEKMARSTNIRIRFEKV